MHAQFSASRQGSLPREKSVGYGSLLGMRGPTPPGLGVLSAVSGEGLLNLGTDIEPPVSTRSMGHEVDVTHPREDTFMTVNPANELLDLLEQAKRIAKRCT